jgi:hypothetical protein
MEKLKIFTYNGDGASKVEDSFNKWCKETEPIITRITSSGAATQYVKQHVLYVFYLDKFNSPTNGKD